MMMNQEKIKDSVEPTKSEQMRSPSNTFLIEIDRNSNINDSVRNQIEGLYLLSSTNGKYKFPRKSERKNPSRKKGKAARTPVKSLSKVKRTIRIPNTPSLKFASSPQLLNSSFEKMELFFSLDQSLNSKTESKTSKVSKTNKNTKKMETLRTPKALKTPKTLKTFKSLKALKTFKSQKNLKKPKSPNLHKTSKTPKTPNTPKTPKTPKTTKSPKTLNALKIFESSDCFESPNPSKTPRTHRTPRNSKITKNARSPTQIIKKKK